LVLATRSRMQEGSAVRAKIMVAPESKLSSTQIGAIAENVVANVLMRDSAGRLSPFRSVADDDGIDLLVYDKQSGAALPVQVKSRTNALKNKRTGERGNIVHFEIRASALREYELAHVIAVLLSPDLASIRCAWFIPMRDIVKKARRGKDKYIIRASHGASSRDKFTTYRCGPESTLAQGVVEALEHRAGNAL
jgi:hypothetical protein